MLKYDEEINFNSLEYIDMAKSLYGKNGYVVIPNFIPKNDLDKIVLKYTTLDYSKQLLRIKALKENDPNNYHNFLMTYMYKNKKSNFDKDIFKYVYKAFDLRNMVALQRESDLFLLDYCQRYNIEPNNLDELREHQLNHSFVRVAWYREGEGQIPHYDNPGEIQAIIFLTQKGIDYEKGGLKIIEDGNELDVDSIVNAGDLVLFNSYKKFHRVEPIVCNENQIGRMHIFIPLIRDYWFPKTYFFKENPNELFFSLPLDIEEKERLYKKHLIALEENSAVPIDLNKD